VRNKSNICPATIVQHQDDFTPGGSDHNHSATPEMEIAVKITSEIYGILIQLNLTY